MRFFYDPEGIACFPDSHSSERTPLQVFEAVLLGDKRRISLLTKTGIRGVTIKLWVAFWFKHEDSDFNNTLIILNLFLF